MRRPSPVIGPTGELPAIRNATAEDLPALVQCDAYARSHPQRHDFLAEAIHRSQCLVAWLGAVPVGYIVLNYSFFSRGFIPLVVVAHSARRRGVAQLLFAAAQRRCRSEALFTSTNLSNVEAQRLFERAGFKPSGRIENLDAVDPELIYYKRCVVRSTGADPSAEPTPLGGD